MEQVWLGVLNLTMHGRGNGQMSENQKLWEKIKEMPGGDQNPFETPFGPTKECLTSNQVVAYVRDKARDPKVVEHLSKCSSCRKRITNLAKLTAD